MQPYFIHGHRDEYKKCYFVALKFKVGNNLVVLWLFATWVVTANTKLLMRMLELLIVKL